MGRTPVPEGDDTRGVGLLKGMEVARKAKVADLEVPVAREQQVGQLQVAAHDPARVQVVHGLQQLHEHRHSSLKLTCAAPAHSQLPAQRHQALCVLHTRILPGQQASASQMHVQRFLKKRQDPCNLPRSVPA